MRILRLLLLVLLLTAASRAADFTITAGPRYDPEVRQPKILRDFLARHPNVHIEKWSGLTLPANGARASLAMAMAANNGPDMFENDIRQAVDQGLAYPMTEWIGQDGVLKNGAKKRLPNGTRDLNGQIDADEAKWDGWMKIKPLFRQVVTVDGKPYALPNRGGTYVGILYSKRLIRRAGLDPMKPPRTWDEFARWCRLLYEPKSKVFGVELTPASWAFAPWVATTGSSIVVQERKSQTTGKIYTFNEQELQFRAPDTGEDLSRVKPRWRANVAHDDAAAAVGFYHRLRWAPWIKDAASGEPVELKPADIKRGEVTFRGRKVRFKPGEVIRGSISVTTTDLMETLKRLGRDLAMYPLWAGDMTEFQENAGIQPEDLGMMPFPGMTARQKPVLQASNWFYLIGKDVAHRGGKTDAERKSYRDLVWNIISRITSVEGADEDIRRKVAAGQARFMNPRDLERLGFTDYVREIPPENRLLWDDIEGERILEVVEPFMGRWLQFRDFYQREAVELVLRPNGENFNYQAALNTLERDADSGIMFERPESALDAYRPRARLLAAFIALVMALFTFLLVRDARRRTVSRAGVYKGALPWFMLAPALLSIAVWGYYPLARGLVMAFQDYKIVGQSRFVGLTNFISIALDPNFYHYLFTTFRFVAWNLGLAFFAPIILAFMLAEVPRGKVFFRTLFFLPQMTSGLVVTLLWKEMYAPTASGTLNKIGAFLIPPDGIANQFLGLFQQQLVFPIDWLGSPALVMACVILPGVWAGAGIGSLIYLAALNSVPEDLYEAASIDGAGVRHKIWHITLPTIAPLILINFIGTFIGVFQAMGNIFLLTFGGPGKETMVMGMAIWQEAYVNLRFSLATSYAWILGSLLIGFTYLQLRILRRVDFRQAKGE